MTVPPKPCGALRRAGRRAGAYAGMALAPLLAFQLGLLWLLHDGAEIVLPDSAAGLLRGPLARAGLSCSWSRASVSLSGRIELRDAKVAPSGGSDPVFEAGRLVAVLDIFDLVTDGRVTPRRLWIDRGRLLCPSVLSPTGRPEVALDGVRAALSREGDRLVVETLQAKCAGIPLVAHGALLPPGLDLSSASARKKGEGAGVKARAPLRAPAQAAARLVALRPWLDRLEGASLVLSGEGAEGGVRLSLDGLADAVRMPDADVERVRIHAGARWTAEGPKPDGDVTFSVGELRVRRRAEGALPALQAECGRVLIAAPLGVEWSGPTRARLIAHRPVVNGLPLDRVDLRFDWAARPALRFDVDALWRRERVSAQVTLDADTGETDIAYEAHVRPSELRRYPAYPRKLPAEVEAFRVTGFADIAGSVRLGRKFAFERATARLESGHTRFFAIDVPSFRAAVEVKPGWLRAYDLDALSPSQRVQGSFESGLKADSPYRLLLRGWAYPDQVAPFVGSWWTDIWTDLAVTPGYPGYADIEVSGQFSGKPHQFILASIHARKLSYRKQVFDRVALRLLELPHRFAIHDIALANPDGTHAGGRLEWAYTVPDHRLDSVRFLFNGRLPLRVAAELGGAEVAEALSELRVDRPAEATVTGRYHGPASPTPGRDQLEVRVESRGPFEAWSLPGEDFSGTVLLDGDRIRIKDAKLRFAGGDAAGEAWLLRRPSGYRMTFDAAVAKCDRAAFFDALSRLKSGSSAAPAGKAPDATPAVKPDLSGRLRARIELPEFSTMDGAGRFSTDDPALLRLPLFGVISSGLAHLGVNVGNFTFDRADGDFILRAGSVWFPELTVRGPKGQINLKGSYAVESDALHFRAVLNPKSPDKIPLLDTVRAFANRATRAFPVDIRGTLAKPEWSVDLSPTAVFRDRRDDSIGLPPAPPPDDGAW